MAGSGMYLDELLPPILMDGNLDISENQTLEVELDNLMMVVLSPELGVISSIHLLNTP